MIFKGVFLDVFLLSKRFDEIGCIVIQAMHDTLLVD